MNSLSYLQRWQTKLALEPSLAEASQIAVPLASLTFTGGWVIWKLCYAGYMENVTGALLSIRYFQRDAVSVESLLYTLLLVYNSIIILTA